MKSSMLVHGPRTQRVSTEAPTAVTTEAEAESHKSKSTAGHQFTVPRACCSTHAHSLLIPGPEPGPERVKEMSTR